MLERLFRRGAARKPEPVLPGAAKPQAKAASRYSLTDAVLVGVGLGICAASAVFPWYVFFNQDQFGAPVVAFDVDETPSDLSGPFYTPRVQWAPKSLTEEEIAALSLDLAPTGTVPAVKPADDLAAAGAQAIPVQAGPAGYALVHVANGRAMIQDGRGLWVVERGSVLPDNSRVSAIEMHDGAWAIRTSDGRFVQLKK